MGVPSQLKDASASLLDLLNAILALATDILDDEKPLRGGDVTARLERLIDEEQRTVEGLRKFGELLIAGYIALRLRSVKPARFKGRVAACFHHAIAMWCHDVILLELLQRLPASNSDDDYPVERAAGKWVTAWNEEDLTEWAEAVRHIPLDSCLAWMRLEVVSSLQVFQDRRLPDDAGELATPAKVRTVTLLQIAIIARKSKQTFERLKAQMPPPKVKVAPGSGGADEWDWEEVRPWLVNKFPTTPFPEVYPGTELFGR